MSASTLRILIAGLNYAPEPTGIAPYTAGLARGLARRGHDVRVLTAFPHYPQWRVMPGYRGLSQFQQLDQVRVDRRRHYISRGANGLGRAISEVSFGSRLVSAPWGTPDVVVCVSPALLSSAMVVSRVRAGWRRPALGLIMQDLYSAGMEETKKSGCLGQAVTRLEGWTANHVDGVAVIHERLKLRVSSSLNVPKDSITVVRNWTHVRDVAEFDRDDFRRHRGWAGKGVCLHAGAMGEKQALDNVVEAARFSERQGWNLHFVLMGDGSQRKYLEEISHGSKSIEFLDPLPDQDYGRAMRSADVLLVNERPGVKEMAVPSKLTSYFSTGVPVLAACEASSTTAGELAASGAGVLIGPGEPELLATAAMDLCVDTVRAAEMGSRGPRYCMEVLSEEQAISSYEAWIRDLTVRAVARRGEA
ncbi:MAG: glycosyltransferase family 4 protein [Actinobacteria bacterium]|nr:glycosyltransferase family 4 protein [Actinomycetota bacterium]